MIIYRYTGNLVFQNRLEIPRSEERLGFLGCQQEWDLLTSSHTAPKLQVYAIRISRFRNSQTPRASQKNMTHIYIYIYVYICDIYQSSCWLNLNPRCPIGAVGESRGPAAREHPQLGTGKTRMPQAWRRGFLQGSGSTAQNFWWLRVKCNTHQSAVIESGLLLTIAIIQLWRCQENHFYTLLKSQSTRRLTPHSSHQNCRRGWQVKILNTSRDAAP